MSPYILWIRTSLPGHGSHLGSINFVLRGHGQLKIGGSVTKEEGDNGYWGQLAVIVTIAVIG